VINPQACVQLASFRLRPTLEECEILVSLTESKFLAPEHWFPREILVHIIVDGCTCLVRVAVLPWPMK
jgi:hypothetical protein